MRLGRNMATSMCAEITDAFSPTISSYCNLAFIFFKDTFSILDILNSRLHHAAAFIDPADATLQSAFNILYIVNEFGPKSELQSRSRDVDLGAACAAAGK